MWYNGTELSAKARRALENETVTIVAHNTGYIHTMYPTATIDKNRYGQMQGKLVKFLSTDVTYEILANFLRHKSSLQKNFQVSHNRHGKTLYIEAEKVYSYEHSSKLRIGDETQALLLQEIENDDFYTSPCPNRFDMGKLETFMRENKIRINCAGDLEILKSQLTDGPVNSSYVVNELIKFCQTAPVMPSVQKEWAAEKPINLDGVKSAADARDALMGQRSGNETVDLAFMAFRDLSTSPWKPFLKAATERNPVCVSGIGDLTTDEAYSYLASPAFPEESIYNDPCRLAQPDEVWNYRRGDGLEKAITLASIHINKNPDSGNIALDIDGDKVNLTCEKKTFRFSTAKKLAPPASDDWR
jgi:hypothetical protein